MVKDRACLVKFTETFFFSGTSNSTCFRLWLFLTASNMNLKIVEKLAASSDAALIQKLHIFGKTSSYSAVKKIGKSKVIASSAKFRLVGASWN